MKYLIQKQNRYYFDVATLKQKGGWKKLLKALSLIMPFDSLEFKTDDDYDAVRTFCYHSYNDYLKDKKKLDQEDIAHFYIDSGGLSISANFDGDRPWFSVGDYDGNFDPEEFMKKVKVD